MLKTSLRTNDSGMSLTVFTPGANLGLHDIYVTPNMAGKVITNFDLSKASGSDFNLVVVIRTLNLNFCT